MQRYFQQELFHLKELGRGFAEKHPSLAPMLAGPSSDPDVERLLEGTAFLTGLLRRKLDDEFPEIIHDVMDLVAPQYLRPIPATTVIAFAPGTALSQPQMIPAGVTCASKPVEGTACSFRTCYDTLLQPLRVAEVRLDHPAGMAPAIVSSFEADLPLATWRPQAVRLFINDDRAVATDLYRLLFTQCAQVAVIDETGKERILSPSVLRPVGFDSAEGVIPYPRHALPGYRLLQEYFFCPEKFLFFDIDLSEWRAAEGRTFDVRIELHSRAALPVRITKENLVLHATPAINIFPHASDPVALDHTKTDYLVRPSGRPGHQRVFAVESVRGIRQGTLQERHYEPFNAMRGGCSDEAIYRIARRAAPFGEDLQVSISIPYVKGAAPEPETLSIRLTCTNGDLGRHLKPGDICVATDSTPTFATFRNITAVRPEILPPLGSDVLWRLQSHMALNGSSLEADDNLKSLLGLYLFESRRDSASTAANRKRIEGIAGVAASAADRIVKGLMMRGRRIELRVREDHFASSGDVYLFGCVMDRFLAGAASLNSFTALTIREEVSGELLHWTPRCGNRPLL